MQRHILSLLMSMVVLSPMAIDIYLASIPQMAFEFNASTGQVQLTIVLFFFAMGLGQIFVGPIADRYGRRPVAIFGLSFYVLGSLAAGLASDIFYLQISRLIQGFAACAISVTIFSTVRDTYSYERSSKIYSYLNGVLGVVPACAPILGSLLASDFGWRSNFLFMFAYGLLVLGLVCRFMPETLKAENRYSSAVAKLYDWPRFLPILKSHYFIFYALCCMVALAAILSYVSYAPLWLIGHLQISKVAFSLLFGLNACAGIFCSFTAPILINRYGNRTLVFIALSCMLGAALLLMVFNSLFNFQGFNAALAFMLPIILLSAGLSFALGPATSMALSQFGDRAGSASALLGFTQMVGASVITFLVQQTDLIAPLAVATVLVIFVLPLWLIMLLPKYSHWNDERSAQP